MEAAKQVARERATSRARPPVLDSDWALDPPRQQQSPVLADWRAECRRRGIEPLTAAEEEASGLGSRDAPIDHRPLLGPKHPAIRRAQARIAVGKAKCGLNEPAAGRLASCWREWEKTGASKTQISWLRYGFHHTFKAVPIPIGSGGPRTECNLPGCEDPAMRKWFLETILELVILGCLIEVARRPFLISGMGPVEKSGFDPVLRPDRLRLIVDHRLANIYIHAPKFRMETLHRARHLFEKDHVILSFDECCGFWSGLNAPSHRQLMGIMVQGRCFV